MSVIMYKHTLFLTNFTPFLHFPHYISSFCSLSPHIYHLFPFKLLIWLTITINSWLHLFNLKLSFEPAVQMDTSTPPQKLLQIDISVPSSRSQS